MKQNKLKQNKALLPILIIAGVAILMAIIITIANICMARQTNQNYALTNDRIMNILNTQSQQSGEIKLTVKSNKGKALSNSYVIVNPRVAQFSNHNFKLDPWGYYTENYVYCTEPNAKTHKAPIWDRLKIQDRDDLHLQYQRILMNAAVGLNENKMLNHKEIALNRVKFSSDIDTSNMFKHKPVVTAFKGQRVAKININNNACLRQISRALLFDMLGSSYTLNFTLAPETIKIQKASAALYFKQNFNAKNYVNGSPIAAPVKDLAITYHFTAKLPDKDGKMITRQITLTAQNLGRHRNLNVPKRIVKTAKTTAKNNIKKAQRN